MAGIFRRLLRRAELTTKEHPRSSYGRDRHVHRPTAGRAPGVHPRGLEANHRNATTG